MNPFASLLSTLAKSMLPTVLNTVLKEVTNVLAHRSSEHHKNADAITALQLEVNTLKSKVEKIEKIIEDNSEQVKESV